MQAIYIVRFYRTKIENKGIEQCDGQKLRCTLKSISIWLELGTDEQRVRNRKRKKTLQICQQCFNYFCREVWVLWPKRWKYGNATQQPNCFANWFVCGDCNNFKIAILCVRTDGMKWTIFQQSTELQPFDDTRSKSIFVLVFFFVWLSFSFYFSDLFSTLELFSSFFFGAPIVLANDAQRKSQFDTFGCLVALQRKCEAKAKTQRNIVCKLSSPKCKHRALLLRCNI